MRSHLNVRSATAVLLCVCLAALSAPVAAQRAESADAGLSAERLQRIGQMIERRIAANDISGAVTLVARHGRIVHFEARGLMDIDSKKPMSKDALFGIASMTKPITATAILMLVEEGRVRLTDPVSQFIPQFKELKVAVAQDQTVPASREITIRDLLTHTSGIVTAPQIPPQATETLAHFIPGFAVAPLEFQPGTRWAYSNTVGFDLLARIVEVVSGQTFDRFLRERIFEPLGMKSTSHALEAGQKLRLATRYERTATGLKIVQRADTSAYFGGGWGLSSTAEDYLHFAQMLLNKGELDGKRLLSPRSVELMSSVHIPDTLPGRQPGEGWGLSVRVITDAAARTTWLPNGSFGWSGAAGTHFWVDPKDELIAILMIQTPATAIRPDFETAVMQSIVTK